MILQPSSSNCSGTIPFNVPCVPTGINTGVSTTLWGKVILDVLAFVVLHSARILNESACTLVAAMLRFRCTGQWKQVLQIVFVGNVIARMRSVLKLQWRKACRRVRQWNLRTPIIFYIRNGNQYRWRTWSTNRVRWSWNPNMGKTCNPHIYHMQAIFNMIYC